MKNFFLVIILAAILLAGCAAYVHPVVYEPDPGYNNLTYNPQPDDNQAGYYSEQTDQVFYDDLSQYGRWIDYPSYGYVWVPNVGIDFRPYATNGYWVYSDYGWTWVSDYPWGWATFHYGRWFYDDYYGWTWVPGNDWAPAWVTWGQSGDYYCWAPLAPGISMQQAAGGWWTPPVNSWNVVPAAHITQVTNYYVVENRTVIVNNIRVINNTSNDYGDYGHRRAVSSATYYNRGPQVHDVERIINRPLHPVRLNDKTKPGASAVSNDHVSVYRPYIRQNSGQNNNRPAPQRVEQYRRGDDMIKVPQRQNPNPVNDQRPDQQRNPDQNRRDNWQRNQQNEQPPVNPNPQPNNQQRNPGQNRRDNGQRNQQNSQPPVNPNPQPNDQQQNPDQNRRDNGQRNQQNSQPPVNPNPQPNNQQQNPDQNRRDNGQRNQPNTQPPVNPNPQPNNQQPNHRPEMNPAMRLNLKPVRKEQQGQKNKPDTVKRGRNPKNQ